MMEKLKQILLKKHYVREIMTLFFIVLSLLFLSIYTSLAVFTGSYEMEAVASIQASTLNITMSTDEDPTETNTKNIVVTAGETYYGDVLLTNNSTIASKYRLYYESTSYDSSIKIGMSSITRNAETGVLTPNGEYGYQKLTRIVIENGSSSDITVTIGVQGGYAHNEVILNTGNAFSNTIYEDYKDPSGANEPVLADGMIPVEYDEMLDVWVTVNEEYNWYNYKKQKWGNAVTVNSTASTCTDNCIDTIEKHDRTYYEANPGTPISMDDINAMWVWIPRYEYKIPSDIGTGTDDSPIKSPPQIDVIFELGTETNGVTEAVYRTGIADDGTNTNYYTHPSFRNIDNIEYDSSTTSRGAWDEELTGFWVGKFETGNNSETCNTNRDEDSCKDVNPIIKPNVLATVSQSVSTQFTTALKFAGGTMDSTTGEVTFAGNDIYGLTGSSDTHMMKNTEWGAVAILSQSQYGKMGNNSYESTWKELYFNNSSLMYTGRSRGTSGDSANEYGTYSYNDMKCSESVCNGDKITSQGTGASTTGTIYGIYDMSGGALENVMGNGKLEIMETGFTIFPESKYYDLYLDYDSSETTKTNSIMGDSLWETKKWYYDGSNLSLAWYFRGGYYLYATSSGIFYYEGYNGYSGVTHSYRTTLIP